MRFPLAALLPVVACAACSATPSTSTTTLTSSDAPLHVVVGAGGPISIAGTPVTEATFTAMARESAKKHRAFLIDADGNVPFRAVASTAETLKQAGATSVSTGMIIGNATVATPNAPPAIPHATIADGGKWDCTFPSGSTVAKTNVLVKVLVEANGMPAKVDVLEDPGQGFGKAAQTCAMTKSYVPAKDPSGASMRAPTFPFYVQFVTR